MAARKPTAETVDTASFDAFWAEVQGKRQSEIIRGVSVPVPDDLPIRFRKRMIELQDSDRDEDVQELVGMIFGEGILDQWIAAGMGGREFKVVMTWGLANGGGKPTSFREAFDIVQNADAQGKEASAPSPNRAARRAATNSRSSATGTTSKRTSSASTASAPRTSRA